MEPETSTKPPGVSNRVFAASAIAVVVVVAAVAWVVLGPEGDGLTGGDRKNAPVLENVVDEPVSGAVVATQWSSPSAAVAADDRLYILDTGNNRILSTDGLGVVDAIICETDDCAFTLASPEDMDIHDKLFYVANTGRGTVEVIDLSGSVVRTMEFPPDENAARPSGIYVADDGTAYVSDATSGRVGIFTPDGEFRDFFGEAEGPGAITFSHPSGLAVDSVGNLYVAEFVAGRIQKFTPAGRHLAIFEMVPGAVNVSEATDVVIGDNGFVYMADKKRAIVHVFAESDRYLGIIGLLDASRRDSPGVLLEPYGLAIDGDQLTVIDRRRGQFAFRITPEYFLQEPAS